MRLLAVSLTLSLSLLSVPAAATDDPHGSANSIECGQCHIAHQTLGDILVDSTDGLVSTLCLSCHSPGGWVPMNKNLSPAEMADPGVSGTSHPWDVPAVNTARQTLEPQNQVLLDHLASDGSITCATCHDPHENTNPPFLRLDNSADALCLDCHRERNMTSTRTWTGSKLSHPVNLTVPVAGFHSPPYDVDGSPQPSDGNLTNDFDLTGGIMRCTTCHGVHGTDSDSATVDGL